MPGWYALVINFVDANAILINILLSIINVVEQCWVNRQTKSLRLAVVFFLVSVNFILIYIKLYSFCVRK